MTGPLVFAILLTGAVLVVFFALGRFLDRQDPVDARLAQYGLENGTPGEGDAVSRGSRRKWVGVGRLVQGLGMGERLAAPLARADVPMTVPEFALLILGLALAGFVIGTLVVGFIVGVPLACLCGFLPIFYLRSRANKRNRAFADQLPDILTLLVSGLRAGHGLSQALEMLVAQTPAPAAGEFARVTRGMSLGMSIQASLQEMTRRIASDDLFLVVTAITVQYEMGGNLAQTLETIGETIRDRIRIKREIQTFTAQQRFTGTALALLPLGLGVFLFFINREYMMALFEPGWIRMVPAIAVGLQVVGFLVIQKIVSIEV